MDQEYKIRGTWLIVAMPEEVDHHSSSRLHTQIDAILDHHKIQHIILDFSQTIFMDSSGIGMIMGRFRKIIKKNGDISAINVNDRMRRIFLLSGIHKWIGINQNEVES